MKPIYFLLFTLYFLLLVGCRAIDQYVQPDPKTPPIRFEGVRLPGNTAVIKAVIDTKTGIADVLLNPRKGTDIKQSLKLLWFNLTTWFRDIWWIIIFVCAFAEFFAKAVNLALWLGAKAIPWLAPFGKVLDWLLKICPKWVLTVLAGGICSLYLIVFKHADKWYAIIIPAISVLVANIAWEYIENKLKLVTTTVNGTKNVVTGYIKKRVAYRKRR